jgi:hypothetical protein
MKIEEIEVGRKYKFLIPGFKKELIGRPSGICGKDIFVHIHQIFTQSISNYEINAWISLKDFAEWITAEVDV